MGVSSPHDALFKFVFAHPEDAASELRAVLPLELSQRLDWSSLTPQPANFVDERLSGRQADLLFSIRCEGRQTFLYVLFEHQSTNDPLMAFRLLRYMVRIWDSFLAAHPQSLRLPAILPVVLHHSDMGWTAATDLASLIDVDAEMLSNAGSYIPQFRFIVDDLSGVDDHTLRARSLTNTAVIGLVLLSRARNDANLVAELRRWLGALRQIALARNGLGVLSAFLRYALQVGEVQPEELRQLALEIGPVAQEAYVTAAQILTKESYAQGRAEGEARGKAEGKAEGKVEGKAELLVRLLGLRFGPLPDAIRERIAHATHDDLDVWAERIITGANLEEVLSR